MPSPTSGAVDLSLQPKQTYALRSPATEILYGGAAGGGKSHLMRVLAALLCYLIPGIQVYLFRRISEDLTKNHMEGPQGFRAMLAPWVEAGACSIIEDEIKFRNGAKIYLCHCKDEDHRFKYQGAEIHVLLVDELTHFTEVIYRFLRSRVRAIGLSIPADARAQFAQMGINIAEKLPLILCGSNPGNIGHAWVRRTFIQEVPALKVWRTPDSEGAMLRQFIPARLSDNQRLQDDDPTYLQRLRGLGSEALVRAMEHGDWDVIEGAFFDCWDSSRHIIQPVDLPDHWLRFRSCDWGSAKPFSVGWWAVVGDTLHARNEVGDEVIVPRGGIVRYREWYGVKREKGITYEDVGLKLTAEEFGAGIAKREQGERIEYGVIDPSTFAENGGPSLAERIHVGSGRKVFWRPADNTRVPQRGAMGGWDQLRARLLGDADGNPMLVAFDHCVDLRRTLPVLQHDPDRMEDLDTAMEDHVADEVRYACMSRPWVRDGQRVKKKGPAPGTFDWLLKVTGDEKPKSIYRS